MQEPPQPFYIPLERRRFLKSLALISAGLTVPVYLAEAPTLRLQRLRSLLSAGQGAPGLPARITKELFAFERKFV